MSTCRRELLRATAIAALVGLGTATTACRKDVPAPPPLPAPAATPAPPPAPPPAPTSPEDPSAAKIVVDTNGKITFNGKAATLDEVKKVLADPQQKPASILYQRLGYPADPSPEGAPIVHDLLLALQDSKIPMRMQR